MKKALLSSIEQNIRNIQKAKHTPLRIAINGVEGAGKTTFARDCTKYLQKKGFDAIHVTIDGFHHTKAIRYRQGRDSADGYYEDAFDEESFVEKVLLQSQQEPFSYVPKIHDLATDELLEVDPLPLSDKSILITDGAYLLKAVYQPHWDLAIYLSVDFNTAMERGIERDQEDLGGREQAKQKFLDRYHAASKRYIEEVHPEQIADIVIDNTDFEDPIIKNQRHPEFPK